MYGFVYQWHDSATNMKYVGSHHGSLDDGYIGSGKWFKAAFRKRPQDFSRIILQVNDVIDDHKFTRSLEQIELDRIPLSEYGKSYYNLKPFASGGCEVGRTTPEEVRLKISRAVSANVARGQKISQAQFGVKKSEAACLAMSKAKLGKELVHKRKTYLLENEDGFQITVIGLQIWLKQNGISCSSLNRYSKRNEFWKGWKIINVEGAPLWIREKV